MLDVNPEADPLSPNVRLRWVVGVRLGFSDTTWGGAEVRTVAAGASPPQDVDAVWSQRVRPGELEDL